MSAVLTKLTLFIIKPDILYVFHILFQKSTRTKKNNNNNIIYSLLMAKYSKNKKFMWENSVPIFSLPTLLIYLIRI